MINNFKNKEDKKKNYSVALIWPSYHQFISFEGLFELARKYNIEVVNMRYLRGQDENMNNFIVNGSSKDVEEFRNKLPSIFEDFKII